METTELEPHDFPWEIYPKNLRDGTKRRRDDWSKDSTVVLTTQDKRNLAVLQLVEVPNRTWCDVPGVGRALYTGAGERMYRLFDNEEDK